MKHFPVVIFGKDYHKQLLAHVKQLSLSGTININDANLFLITDSVDEVINHIDKYAIVKFNLNKVKKLKPFNWLGERA